MIKFSILFTNSNFWNTVIHHCEFNNIPKLKDFFFLMRLVVLQLSFFLEILYNDRTMVVCEKRVRGPWLPSDPEILTPLGPPGKQERLLFYFDNSRQAQGELVSRKDCIEQKAGAVSSIFFGCWVGLKIALITDGASIMGSPRKSLSNWLRSFQAAEHI